MTLGEHRMSRQSLPPRKEHYCQLRAQGWNIGDAYREAGYKGDPSWSEADWAARGRRLDADTEIQLRIGLIREEQGILKAKAEAAKLAAKQVEFNADNVDLAYVNRKALEICEKALDADRFDAALGVLKFMAETNGIIHVPRKGRIPFQGKTPNAGDLSANRETSEQSDEDAAAESAEFAELFNKPSDAPGRESSPQDTPFFRRRRGTATVAAPDGSVEPAEFVECDPGSDGDE